MKKNLFRFLMIMFLVVPCALMFSACGKKKDNDTGETPNGGNQSPIPEKVVSELSLELAEEHGFDYDAETNTITFVYGDEIEILKEKFVLTATYEDESTLLVSDYTIDDASVENTPNVGTYTVNFTYKQKTASVNVKINPKPIERPTIENSVFNFQQTFDGIKTMHTPEIVGFDVNSMEYVDGSTISSENAGKFFIDVIPNQNHVWSDTEDREVIKFDWQVNKASAFIAGFEEFTFEHDGNDKTVEIFEYNPQFYPFDKYFEIDTAHSVLTASEVGEYAVVIKLREEFASNYVIFDFMNDARNDDGVGDFSLNAEENVITYYWQIV